MASPQHLFANLADSRRGILWMLGSMIIFANVNAISKYLQLTYPFAEVMWARFFFHVVFLVLILRGRLFVHLKSARPGLQLVRSAFMLASTVGIFLSLHLVPMVETTAMLAMAPLLVTALSVPVLGEAVGVRRWSAVGAAFIGALIIIRPGTQMMQVAIVVPLLAATVLSMYQISTRLISRSDAALTTFVYTPAVGFVACSVAVPFFWVTPDAFAWLLMAGLGVLGGGAHYTMIKAFEAAPAATVAPFHYTGIVWAAIYGYFLFGDLPDLWVISGAAIIVLSGLYVFQRSYRWPDEPGG